MIIIKRNYRGKGVEQIDSNDIADLAVVLVDLAEEMEKYEMLPGDSITLEFKKDE